MQVAFMVLGNDVRVECRAACSLSVSGRMLNLWLRELLHRGMIWWGSEAAEQGHASVVHSLQRRKRPGYPASPGAGAEDATSERVPPKAASPSGSKCGVTWVRLCSSPHSCSHTGWCGGGTLYPAGGTALA